MPRLLLIALLLFALPVGLATTGVAWADTPAVAPSKAMADEESDDASDEDDEDSDAKHEDGDHDDDEHSPSDDDEDSDDNDGDNDEDGDEDGDKPEAEKAKSDDDKKDDDDTKDDDEEKDRKTTEAETKRVKVDVTVDAVFVAREMTEITLKPEAWSTFEITEIIPHGATVRQGQTLVKFDDEELEEELENLELQQRISEIALTKAEASLPRLEKALEMQLADAEQASERTNEDYRRYIEEERDFAIEALEMSLKSSKQRLEYAQDELTQLEKMYEADDLTEETEEIILTRTRQEVEMAEFYYERAKRSFDQAINIRLPRNDVDNREVLDRVALNLQQAREASQLDLNEARYELEKIRRNRQKSLERHADLTADRSLLEIKAPTDGVVYYGRCVNGNWADMASLQQKLQPEKNAPTNAVLMTIVDTEPMYLLATLSEKAIIAVEEGQSVRIQPTAEDADALEGRVASVSRAPISKGKYQLEIDITESELPEWLMPGMTGKAKITTYNEPNAVVIDKKAIKTEEDDEDAKYVWLVEGEDDELEVVKKKVKVGKTKGDVVEILKGLEEGDVVSLEDEKEDDEE